MTNPDPIEIIFLGQNQAGKEVYNWLNQEENVYVKALLTEEDQLELIHQIKPELVISSGFKHKVPKETIDIPEKGIVNLHPSFLPYNRGAHPYIWPIIDDTPAGVSIHYMTEKIDHGPIIDRKEVPVRPEDTAKKLHQRLMTEQARQFKENWEKIKNNNTNSRKQQKQRGTEHYRKDLEQVRKINLRQEKTMEELLNQLKGLTYSPKQNAYIEINGKKYFVDLKITPEEEISDTN